MAKLAILGHATRGKEVIELLEMLGGVNTYTVSADEEELPFTIRDDDSIMVACYPTGEFVIYTLEEFLEKFPYKVGDRVFAFGNKCTIINAVWDGSIDEVDYTIKLDTSEYITTKLSNQLQFYKEEITNNMINIAELLKDCPKGMKLYSPIFGEVYLDKIRPHLAIVVTIDKEQGDSKEEFLYDGRYGMNGECMLFPSKGKNTWEGFVPPCKFKEGDVVVSNYGDIHLLRTEDSSYCAYRNRLETKLDYLISTNITVARLATEEEKQKLFQAIKDNGYTWNANMKCLEELDEPKFKPGDVLVSELGNLVLLSHIDSENIVHYHCIITTYNSFRIEENTAVGIGKCYDCVLANEQQRQRMYDKIKSSGYKYNQSTNKLEKVDEHKFKDGDIVFSGNDLISIFKRLSPSKSLHSYVSMRYNGSVYADGDCWTSDNMRLATEEEKEKLFKAIKDNGYKWNEETKTLDKLIEPKFKVGDRIKHRLTGEVYIVSMVLSNGYGGGVYDVAVTNEIGKSINIEEQDNYELVPNKFDITTLKPFESRVLVRDNDYDVWNPAFWGAYRNNSYYKYSTTRGCYVQCIPYEGNEHLLDKTDNCEIFYKTW